jgi:hypothetical protein
MQTLARIVAPPMLSALWRETPCAKTDHGELPSPPRMTRASPVPKSHSPATSRTSRRGGATHRDSACGGRVTVDSTPRGYDAPWPVDRANPRPPVACAQRSAGNTFDR